MYPVTTALKDTANSCEKLPDLGFPKRQTASYPGSESGLWCGLSRFW